MTAWQACGATYGGTRKKSLIFAIKKQSEKIVHSSLFNLTNDQAESLAKRLVGISPHMHKVFYSDDGSTAMEISFKMALQYWQNEGEKNKSQFATLQNGYHGDTFGAMSVGYVPGFFSKFKNQLYKTIQIPFANSHRLPSNTTPKEYQDQRLEKIERLFSNNDKIAAFVMESGAQIAGGVNIYQNGFQEKISRLCKKHGVLLILDEIATGFGRLGSLVEYVSQNSKPDIVSYGKMLTGGYITMAATLVTKNIYDSFLGKYSDMRHIYHGHTFTGNPLSCAVANENLDLYEKASLIKKIQKTSTVFEKRTQEILDLKTVGGVRHKGMLMGIELVRDKSKKTPISFKKSTNKVVFEEARKNGIYLRTLGNIVMLVPPLAISESELNYLIDRTILTIKNISR
ncbi:aspartate aminotransferase family protein [Candidatus Nitrosotenuis chungbukensis]|uniref:aminotransferase family protein n=1 Tax=Candidatus Nitrosotenuis chungbukensis TaxID=1353246 RepID=UPI002A4E1DD9|nr:aminotransferase class III-fold pyridoxal phosphate-dependent enzyme [Candidatus Nitrosotenuis chungbukensis]